MISFCFLWYKNGWSWKSVAFSCRHFRRMIDCHWKKLKSKACEIFLNHIEAFERKNWCKNKNSTFWDYFPNFKLDSEYFHFLRRNTSKFYTLKSFRLLKSSRAIFLCFQTNIKGSKKYHSYELMTLMPYE